MLTTIFGEYPQVKVIDLLLSHPNTEYTKKDIAECANISRSTLYKIWKNLEKFELIVPTRKVGNVQLYKINMESPAVKALDEFVAKTSDIEVEEQIRIWKKKELQKISL